MKDAEIPSSALQEEKRYDKFIKLKWYKYAVGQ